MDEKKKDVLIIALFIILAVSVGAMFTVMMQMRGHEFVTIGCNMYTQRGLNLTGCYEVIQLPNGQNITFEGNYEFTVYPRE